MGYFSDADASAIEVEQALGRFLQDRLGQRRRTWPKVSHPRFEHDGGVKDSISWMESIASYIYLCMVRDGIRYVRYACMWVQNISLMLEWQQQGRKTKENGASYIL